MRSWLLAAVGIVSAGAVRADEPAPLATGSEACPADNAILRPRTPDRPLPLLSGDPAHGFHPACTVRWSTLNPTDRSLPITGCFQASLVRIDNDSACGRNTGPLWVNTRWVVMRRNLAPPPEKPLATCEQLETSALAASREFKPECAPRESSAAAPSAPASADKAARPAAPPSTAEPSARAR
jgi:hypothetical protein